MTESPLDETVMADAWVTGDGSSSDPAGCPAPDRFWEAARGALDAPALHALLDHTASCPHCALALKTACEIHAASGLAPAPRPVGAGHVAREPTVMAWMRATILRPEAALAYLLLLAIGVPVYRSLAPSVASVAPPTPVFRGVRVVGLESEAVTRGGGTAAPTVVAAAGTEAIVLRLFVDREDLVPGATLQFTLSTGDSIISVQSRDASTLGENGTLELAINADSLPRATPLRLTVASGAQRVFERSFVLAPEPQR